MKIITVQSAQLARSTECVEPTTIVIQSCGRVGQFEADAEAIERAMHLTLPGGTYSHLLGLMLRRRASHFVVSFAGQSATKERSYPQTAGMVARRLGVKVAWLRQEVEAGRLPAVDAGDAMLFDADLIDRLLLERAGATGDSEKR